MTVPFDVESFSSVTKKPLENYRDQWGVADSRFLIVYAGAIRMANDLDMLVEAAVELKKKKSRVFIAVIGVGRDRCRLEEKVVDLTFEADILTDRPLITFSTTK